MYFDTLGPSYHTLANEITVERQEVFDEDGFVLYDLRGVRRLPDSDDQSVRRIGGSLVAVGTDAA